MFRSVEMTQCQIFLWPEAAYASMAALGEAGMVQFIDLNDGVNPFQRTYVTEVKRAEEMQRRLRVIEAEITKERDEKTKRPIIEIPESKELPPAPNPRETIELDHQLEKTEMEIQELAKNAKILRTNYMELIEIKYVLEKLQEFFEQQEQGEVNRAFASDEPLQGSQGQLGYAAGVVPRERLPAFERMLWRVSRGNVLFRSMDIDIKLKDPTTGNEVLKSVFIVCFQGEQLKTRVQKICAGFRATVYTCPGTSRERQEMLREVKVQISDLDTVLKQTAEHRYRVLKHVAKETFMWKMMIYKMKAIYHTLNMFSVDMVKKCLIGEGWIPSKKLDTVRQLLVEGGKASGSSMKPFISVMETSEDPPTLYRTNKFTKGFQILIDAYGVASYREVNPALYTIITFPFLFGVMFGDMGHGLILLVFAAWMCIDEKRLGAKKSDNEIWKIFFGGRYIILLMGLFSIYTGFVYNDVFSLSFNIFGSAWLPHYKEFSTIHTNKMLQLDPATNDYYGHPYPYGMDPAWQGAENKIIFLNSFKMKLSIIFGVIHMIFGVVMSIPNHIHFKRKMYIFLQFIPEVLFLVCIFLYLCVLMFIKWIMYSPTSTDVLKGTTCAPSVLILFINMVMFSGSEIQFKECDPYMYPNQRTVQTVLMVIAILCIPMMLVAKPIYVLCFQRRGARHRQMEDHAHENGLTLEDRGVGGTAEVAGGGGGEANGSAAQQLVMTEEGGTKVAGGAPYDEESGGGSGEEEEEEEPASEIIVHQIIHTIEYVLSTISHTASYLRLWALSLAHSQLSDVLWTKIMRNGFLIHSLVSCITVFIIFAIWAFLTMAILILMEGLSAFLHTLRLHWVEFISKFYTGTGYKFSPFSFRKVIKLEEEDLG